MAIIQGSAKSSARGFYPLNIEQSLRFNDNDSAYLSRTPASAGDQQTWTFSAWVKRANIGIQSALLIPHTGGDGSNESVFRFETSDKIRIYDSGAIRGDLYTTRVFRDPSAWYHIVVSVDLTQGTNTDRVKVYVNGELETLTGTYPSSTTWGWNGTSTHYLGTYRAAGSYADCYMAEVHFTDGTAYTADAFGELKSGIWVAKAPSVTYGTNGFYLDFANSADIGNDVSGNANDWTPNNFTASDVVLDSPTDNFATLNPLVTGSYTTLSDGNLKSLGNTSANNGNTRSTFAVSNGKWYAEFVITSASSFYPQIGIVTSADSDRPNNGAPQAGYSSGLSDPTASVIYLPTGNKQTNGSSTIYGSSWTTNDVIGVALDSDNGTVAFYKNGVSQGTALTWTGGTKEHKISIADYNGSSVTANFGQLGFTYTPPTGYLALSTANLPDPVIDPAQDASPSDYFNTVLYTGNGSTQSITGVGFQPDWVWLKSRSAANSHALCDAVRGEGTNGYLMLQSNTTNAEIDGTNLDSLDLDGFTLGSNAGTNGSGATFVAWNWKANGSGVSNTDGTITSTVSANTTSGFSIVSYTGNGSTGGETYGHGLDQAPEMIITKARETNSLNNWPTWHISLNANSLVYLNSTTGQVVETGWMPTLPSASLVYLGTGNTSRELTNNSGVDYIAYCFHSVEGFSRFSSYTGNGSADGPFVYTGFRPAFVIVKCSSSNQSGNAWWVMFDNKRVGYNSDNRHLGAHVSDAEYTANPIDLLSNGFKLRDTNSSRNASGATYIYMAFAETPFRYSLSR